MISFTKEYLLKSSIIPRSKEEEKLLLAILQRELEDRINRWIWENIQSHEFMDLVILLERPLEENIRWAKKYCPPNLQKKLKRILAEDIHAENQYPLFLNENNPSSEKLIVIQENALILRIVKEIWLQLHIPDYLEVEHKLLDEMRRELFLHQNRILDVQKRSQRI